VPTVITVAVIAFAAWRSQAWAIYGPEPRFAHGLVAVVLIIARPWTLGLATPIGVA